MGLAAWFRRLRGDEWLALQVAPLRGQVRRLRDAQQDLADRLDGLCEEVEAVADLANAVAELSDRLVRRDAARLIESLGLLRDEFRQVTYGGFALQTLLDRFAFDSVLDIGCGTGQATRRFVERGKRVTCIDVSEDVRAHLAGLDVELLIGDFGATALQRTFDCVWASHVLEHQPDPHRFLKKVLDTVAPGGCVCVTVPPAKYEVVGGHVALWTAGLLLYRMVLAGFDCREAMVCTYGYNISLIVRRKAIEEMPRLACDSGDVDRLAAYLPEGCGEGFYGDIDLLNWPLKPADGR